MPFIRKRQPVTPRGDTGYNERHRIRNEKRVNSIIKHCTPGRSALDIGCNEGYFSRELLNSEVVKFVDAIEYDAEIVSDDLRQDSRFSLYSGDAIKFSFNKRYHLSIYGAVHHHIFATHGYAIAMRFWLDIVDHTDSLIFLETGQLAEGSRWYWQRALRNYYSNDESYFSDLFSSIGPRLKRVRLIDRHWIHGVRRWLFVVELSPASSVSAPIGAGPHIKLEKQLWRTVGSEGQQLVSRTESHDRSLHEGVSFGIGRMSDGCSIFLKKYLARHKARREFLIGRQINDLHFIRPIDITDDDAIVYPLVSLPTLASVRREDVEDKRAFRDALLKLFGVAEERYISFDFCGQRRLRLIDVIDLHSSNIFYDAADPFLKAFDFEVHALANRARNRFHLAKMLWRWGVRDIRSLRKIAGCIMFYVWAKILASAQSPAQRVVDGTVSPAGRAHTRLRELLDRGAMSLFPGYRQ